MEREIRCYQTELRVSRDTNKPKIVGHAAVFDQWSEDLGGFREKVNHGAFQKTIKEADVRALFNHDSNYVLGRNKAGTLRMVEDDTGLAIEVDPPDTQWARDLMVSMDRGDVSQMSFGFQTVKDKWNDDKKNLERELVEVRLFDVSVVTYPAYPQTTAQVRAIVEEKLTEPVETDHSDKVSKHAEEKPVETDHFDPEAEMLRRIETIDKEK